jgi:hypothetical protein
MWVLFHRNFDSLQLLILFGDLQFQDPLPFHVAKEFILWDILCFSSSSSWVFILLRLHSVGKTILWSSQCPRRRGERREGKVYCSTLWVMTSFFEEIGFCRLVLDLQLIENRELSIKLFFRISPNSIPNLIHGARVNVVNREAWAIPVCPSDSRSGPWIQFVVQLGTKSGTILKNGIITLRGSVWNEVQYAVQVVITKKWGKV